MSHESRVQYRVFDLTLQDKQFSTPLGDAAGRLVVSVAGSDPTNNVFWVSPRALSIAEGAWNNYDSGAALIGTAGLVINAAPGRLRSIGGVNTSVTTGYYLVGVNKAAAPINGDATVFAVPLQDAASNWAGSGNGLDFGIEGMYLSTGIAYAVSTTPHVVTLAAAATVNVFARYM